MNIKTIEENLKSLSLEELQSLKVKIDFQISLKATFRRTGESKQTVLVNLLYNELSQTILRKYSVKTIPWNVLKNKQPKQFKDLVNATLWLDEWFTRVLKRAPTRLESIKLFSLFSELTISWIEKIPNTPVTMKIIIQNTDKFPGLIDRAFPDYLEAGILNILFFQKGKVNV